MFHQHIKQDRAPIFSVRKSEIIPLSRRQLKMLTFQKQPNSGMDELVERGAKAEEKKHFPTG